MQHVRIVTSASLLLTLHFFVVHSHFCYYCGDKIVQSSWVKEIEESVQAHYRRCTMFEVDDPDDSDGEDMSDDGSAEVDVDEGENATDSDEADHGSWTESEVSEGYIDNAPGGYIDNVSEGYSDNVIQHTSYALVARTAVASRQRRGHIIAQ